jgi:hypothetical protein
LRTKYKKKMFKVNSFKKLEKKISKIIWKRWKNFFIN